MKKVYLDPPQYSKDEATELCVHHLRLAAMFFEATPEDANASLNDEIARQCRDDVRALKPSLAWAQQIFEYYENLKRND